MMGGFDGMGIYGGFGMVIGLLFWIGVLVLVVWAVTNLFPAGRSESRAPDAPDTALDILKRRYAAGEINQAEFEQARRSLAS